MLGLEALELKLEAIVLRLEAVELSKVALELRLEVKELRLVPGEPGDGGKNKRLLVRAASMRYGMLLYED